MKYYKITNQADIDLINSVRKSFMDFKRNFQIALNTLGLGKAVFSREYASGRLFEITFEGFTVKEGTEIDHTKIKHIRKNVLSVRRSNKAYTSTWNAVMPKDNRFDCNLMYLAFFSNIKAKDVLDRVHNTNISKIVYETKHDCMLLAVADVVSSSYIVKECHEEILESEWLRLQGR